jgi:hypothetical protein
MNPGATALTVIPREAGLRHDARNIDDPPPPLLHHRADAPFGAEYRSVYVRGPSHLEVLFRHSQQQLIDRDSRIVHENVDAPVPLDRLFDATVH